MIHPKPTGVYQYINRDFIGICWIVSFSKSEQLVTQLTYGYL